MSVAKFGDTVRALRRGDGRPMPTGRKAADRSWAKICARVEQAMATFKT